MGNGGQYNIFKHRLDRLFSPPSTAGRIRYSNGGGDESLKQCMTDWIAESGLEASLLHSAFC